MDAAIEATYGLSDRRFDSGRARVKVSDNEGWGEQCGYYDEEEEGEREIAGERGRDKKKMKIHKRIFCVLVFA